MRAASLFTPEADAVIANAFSWIASVKARTVPPLVFVARPTYRSLHAPRGKPAARSRNAFTFTPADIELLRLMAANCEHLETGGRVIREFDPRGKQYQTEAIGRTQWVGKPEWADAGMSGDEIRSALERAIAGGSLGKRQERLIEAMQAELAATRANLADGDKPQECPF
jgi:hypothetical protein